MAPRPTNAELTNTAETLQAPRLRECAWTDFWVEYPAKTPAEAAARTIAGPERMMSLAQWTTYAELKQWTTDDGGLGTQITDRRRRVMKHNGWVKVGELKGTSREVMARWDFGGTAFDRWNNATAEHEAVRYEGSGARRIQLFVLPFWFKTSGGGFRLAGEKDMTNVYGLDGFVPCADLLDWTLLDLSDKLLPPSADELADDKLAELAEGYGDSVAGKYEIIRTQLEMEDSSA